MVSEIPMEWVDRIFLRFKEFYGLHVLSFPDKKLEDLFKTEWRHGLEGLSATQIKHGLCMCQKKFRSVPSVIEFFALCKNRLPLVKSIKVCPENQIEARKNIYAKTPTNESLRIGDDYLSFIRGKLRYA